MASLSPLAAAGPVIAIHAAAALGAFALGAVQLLRPKSGAAHRWIGGVWVALMVIVAVSSFWIHDLRVVGPWSPLHLLSILVLATAPLAARHALRGRIRAHGRAMRSLFLYALVIAGAFTLLPGRVMHAVLFGP